MSNTIQRVKDARVWLSARIPFLGYMTTRLMPRLATPQDGVMTAAVAPDGTLILCDEFVDKLTEPQLRFVLAHEVMHPALGFWERLQSRDLQRFNVAHDYAINALLKEFSARAGNGMEMPSAGLYAVEFENMAAEEIYNKLGKPSKSALSMMDCRIDLSSTSDGQAAGQGDQAAQRNLQRTWQTALEAARQTHEAQLGQGHMPGSLLALLDEIKDPKVTWQTVLSAWLGENGCKADTTYMRPSRRSEAAGETLPGVLRTGLPDVTIVWDTSGSMNGLAGEILSEVDSITSELGLTVRLMICDAALHADVEGLDKAEDFLPHIKGGGGSDFNPAFDKLQGEGNSSVVLAFTDGYISVPSSQPPTLGGVLWVLTQSGVRPAPWGEAIKLTRDGFVENV
jgi:predicted metal-dependent peptidase